MGAQMLANGSKHLTDELLGRGFGRQHIQAAHHHVDVTARQLLGSPQGLLRAIAFNRDPHEVRRHLDQLQIFRRRASRIAVIHAESAEDFAFPGQDWIRP